LRLLARDDLDLSDRADLLHLDDDVLAILAAWLRNDDEFGRHRLHA
jgi:hypothetical protein